MKILINKPKLEGHRYDILICDGNGAASRGMEDDRFYELSTYAPDLETAIRDLFEDIWHQDLLDYFDEDELEDPNFSVWEYIQENFDITGGEEFIICILEDNRKIYEYGDLDFVVFEEDKDLARKFFNMH